MAKNKLTEADKFYIENHLDVPIKELAKILEKTVPQVRGYINSLPKPKKEQEDKGKTKESSRSKNPLFARREKNGQVIATVMTAGASEQSDSTRPNNRGKKYIDGAVTRIFDKD